VNSALRVVDRCIKRRESCLEHCCSLFPAPLLRSPLPSRFSHFCASNNTQASTKKICFVLFQPHPDLRRRDCSGRHPSPQIPPVPVCCVGLQSQGTVLTPPSGRRSMASTSTRHADITLTVDGKDVTVPQGTKSLPSGGDGGVLIRWYRLCPYSGL
jgi:hypothetical protein